MKIAFRVDSGTHIGTGHLMRCLTLAKKFHKKSHEVIFVSRDHEGSISNKISSTFGCTILPLDNKKKVSYNDNNYQSWLGVSIDQEISDSNAFFKSFSSKFDYIVIDHYGLDSIYEKEMAKHCSKIVVIDDLMNRYHFADYIIDQNLSAEQNRYEKLNTKLSCKYLMGPQYALLKDDFKKFRPIAFVEKKSINNILVFFGGMDISGECKKVVDAFLLNDYPFNIHIILGQGHSDYSHISSAAAINSKIKLYHFIDNMAEFMSKMDVAFGACGATSWERATLALPALTVVSADNQKLVSEALYINEMAIEVGSTTNTSVATWSNVFDHKLDLNHLNIVAKKSFDLVDAQGTERILEILNG